MCKCSIIQFISIFYIMCGYVLIQTLPDMQETMFTHISGVADRNWHTKYIFTRSANLRSLCSHWEYPLEKEMVIHSSILAWKIPWMEETGRLQSMGSQRVWHNWMPEKQTTQWKRGVQRVGHDWVTELNWFFKLSRSSKTTEVRETEPRGAYRDMTAKCNVGSWMGSWNLERMLGKN